MKICKAILIALLFAALIIASADFLKGSAAKVWGLEFIVGFVLLHHLTDALSKLLKIPSHINWFKPSNRAAILPAPG